jgi:hypothetical protein
MQIRDPQQLLSVGLFVVLNGFTRRRNFPDGCASYCSSTCHARNPNPTGFSDYGRFLNRVACKSLINQRVMENIR